MLYPKLYPRNRALESRYRPEPWLSPASRRWTSSLGLALFAFLGVPLWAGDYLLLSLLIPVLILTIAALGLNLLVGYSGQLSLGHAAFMAVGAYTAYNLALRAPALNFLIVLLGAGLSAAAVGVVFGTPSLKIKGLYLAVATLAAQFFLDWVFARVRWFSNYSNSGSVSVEAIDLWGWTIDTPSDRYQFALALLALLTIGANNLVRGHLGRAWMAIRDQEVAAEVIGIRPVHAKLTAFAVSSFYCGVAGALWGFVHLGAWEPLAFNLNLSLNLLFMIIIGGMGSILGAYLGAAFIVILPIALNRLPVWFGVPISTATASHLEVMTFGSLIVLFLILQPHGLARLCALGREKLRSWPFAY